MHRKIYKQSDVHCTCRFVYVFSYSAGYRPQSHCKLRQVRVQAKAHNNCNFTILRLTVWWSIWEY